MCLPTSYVCVFVYKMLPKELENLIWEYKHSAEMYDVMMEFKKWFHLPYAGAGPFNLYNTEAFNYRAKMYEAEPWYFICSIFQADSGRPVDIFGQIPEHVMTEHIMDRLLNLDANRKFNWRRKYIDCFEL